ncbi:sugar diacid recognition domain-containing protein [uncultured Clostridium sp.]|uniref:sugar diacid recognition domain-containing protein n=1 Tax=uncultured Clostridium sp. TaxID=59620 RepID=UPI0025FF3713|nr:sugar diacid recognition domain-containing protein [uncultured Clostridium sp.]
MKLSKAIAPKIVLEMMNVIPYNINVMDENGIIIGSGDNERIGNIHEGAKKAIDSKHIIEVYEDNEKMKPGVNGVKRKLYNK